MDTMIPSDNNLMNTSEEEPTIDLRQYIALFLQWWWLIAIAGILAGVAAFFVSRQMTPIYEAEATVMINTAPAYSRVTDYQSLLTSESLAQTYAEIMTRQPVLDEVSKRMGLNLDAMGVVVSVQPLRDTQLMVVSVEGTHPGVVAAAANMVVTVFSEQITSMQTARFSASKDNLQKQIASLETEIGETHKQIDGQRDPNTLARLQTRLDQQEEIYSNLLLTYETLRIEEAQSISSVELIESAVAPELPIRPQTVQNTLLAAVVGLMLAVGGIFAYDMLDDRIKNPEEITRRFKLTVLGVIPKYNEPEDGRLITVAEPRSPVAESFRALRTNVQYASVDRPLRSLMITSPAPADGKSTVTANLGLVMAHTGRQVAIVDADLHRPRAHLLFQARSRPGLSTLFVQPRLHLNGSFQQTMVEELHVIGPGDLPPNPSELLGSNKMRDIIELVAAHAELVIIDTPPVLAVTDGLALAPLVDGVLLVIKPGVTKMSALKQAIDQLHNVGARIIGVVLNGVDARSRRYGYYYKSSYYRGYGENGKKGKKKATQVVETQPRNEKEVVG